MERRKGRWHPRGVFVRVAGKGVTGTFCVRDVTKGVTRTVFAHFAEKAWGKGSVRKEVTREAWLGKSKMKIGEWKVKTA